MVNDPTIKGKTAIAGLIKAGYEVMDTLGEGGFGVVYKARQKSTGQLVAVKLLSEQMLESEAGDQAVARFQREMNLIADLRHPNVVRLIDSGQLETGALYAVMEFIEGEELAAVIDRREKLEPVEAIRIMGQVLDALCAAHAKGVVHRDLKPANIMLTSTGGRRNAMVLDFGIAGMLEDAQPKDYRKLTTEGQFFGTPAYMAPEQFTAGAKLSPASDIYSWGLIFVECLTGEEAIVGESLMKLIAQHMSSDPIPVPSLFEGHPLGDVLHKALAKDASERYANAQEALAALEKVSTEGLIARPEALGETMDSIEMDIVEPEDDQAADEAESSQESRPEINPSDQPSSTSITPSPPVSEADLQQSSSRRTAIAIGIIVPIVVTIMVLVITSMKDDESSGEDSAAAAEAQDVPGPEGSGESDQTPDADPDQENAGQAEAGDDQESEDEPAALTRVPAAELTVGLTRDQIREDWDAFPKFDVDHDIGLSTREAASFARPAVDVMVHEVTWAEWEKNPPANIDGLCADGTPVRGTAAIDDPVTGVAALEAERYCLGLGMRLPTAREFEAIARGPENRKFSWGNELDDEKRNELTSVRRSAELPWTGTPEGILGLSGGVAEWVRCTGLAYCSDGFGFRGGSFARDPFWSMTTVQGFPPDVPNMGCHRAEDIGFRCVRDAP